MKNFSTRLKELKTEKEITGEELGKNSMFLKLLFHIGRAEEISLAKKLLEN